jgi:hypothetical protein
MEVFGMLVPFRAEVVFPVVQGGSGCAESLKRFPKRSVSGVSPRITTN